MEQHYCWDKFRLEIFIRSEPGAAFKAWATKSGIQKWFRNEVHVQRSGVEISTSEIFKTGDDIKWADLAGDDLYPSKVIEVVADSLLQLTFDSEQVRITSEFKRMNGGTLVIL